MRWNEVRALHPGQWLIVEALAARSEGGRRLVDSFGVLERCTDGGDAYRRYRALHKQFPSREIYFVHTSNEEVTIIESYRVGFGWVDAARAGA